MIKIKEELDNSLRIYFYAGFMSAVDLCHSGNLDYDLTDAEREFCKLFSTEKDNISKEKLPTQLDEKGFIFLDEMGKPFLCKMWGDVPWLFFWTGNGFVSLREVTQNNVWSYPHNLTEEEQNVYRRKAGL